MELLSGVGKITAGQIKILDNFPKEKAEILEIRIYSLSSCSGQAKIVQDWLLDKQVNVFDTFSKQRLNYFEISIPVPANAHSVEPSIHRLCLKP